MSELSVITISNNDSQAIFQLLISELTTIKNEKVTQRKEKVMTENFKLQKQISLTKKFLTYLEVLNDKLQITVNNTLSKVCLSKHSTPKLLDNVILENKICINHSPKISFPKEIANIDISKLDFRIGKIKEVLKHPHADSLYIEQIDCGEETPRTVVSGLVKFVPIEEMMQRLVVIMCNLKPVKIRGVISEAMVMCAFTSDEVELLTPPIGAVQGDLVHCYGYERTPDAQLNPKEKVFETISPHMLTNDNYEACYKGAPLNIPGKGPIKAPSLKNAFIK